jgi:hypothetical protein
LLENLLYCMRMDVDPRGFGPEIMIDTRHTIFEVNYIPLFQAATGDSNV